MKKRILLIDDDPSCGLVLQRVMPAYHLKHELNPERTLEVAMSFQPDLFILDLKMPEMPGAEVAQALHRDPCFDHVPIIFLSAAVWIPDGGDGPSWLHGCPAFPKPFSIERLRAAVAQELARAECGQAGLSLPGLPNSKPAGRLARV